MSTETKQEAMAGPKRRYTTSKRGPPRRRPHWGT